MFLEYQDWCWAESSFCTKFLLLYFENIDRPPGGKVAGKKYPPVFLSNENTLRNSNFYSQTIVDRINPKLFVTNHNIVVSRSHFLPGNIILYHFHSSSPQIDLAGLHIWDQCQVCHLCSRNTEKMSLGLPQKRDRNSLVTPDKCWEVNIWREG